MHNRYRTKILDIIGEHLDRAVEDIESMIIDKPVTVDEVSDELADYPDFQNAWEDYMGLDEGNGSTG